ncbi:MAG: DNA-processing protein DprA [candidate division WOR-3 bacterium]|nr:DNA-processing protein DprA [candidate division WOR-3 bacterium]MDW8113731.1 DNA-processing protein DprA [candidate division WOR-3 bacterium]
MEDKEIKYLFLYSLPKMTERKIRNLFFYFKDINKIFEADKEELLKVDGMDEEIFSYLREGIDKETEEKIKIAEKLKVKIISFLDKGYPKNLLRFPDFPPLLFIRGEIKEDDLALAIIGTRKPSEYSKIVGYRLARELSNYGITIVSGLARGIDSYAHKGAIENNGRTIAVLGCGVDICYPPENKRLMEEIIEKGAVISEFNISTPPESYNFPQRNRIIAGLSLGVIAVEAPIASGVLNTCEWAANYGIEVFACPGPIFKKENEGTNKLIKDGAHIVTKVEDILEGLSLPLKRKLKEIGIEIELKEEEKEILTVMAENPIYIDEISEKLNRPIKEISEILLMLEMKGVVKELPGKRYIKILNY